MLWDSNFATGVKSIDDEHRNLVRMITKLQNSLREGIVTEQTGIVLIELVNYTKHHFLSEENFMKQVHYPELENHRKLHAGLINSVIGILKDLKAGKPFTSIDLIDFLKKWLKEHILDEDKKIGVYWSEKMGLYINNNSIS